MLKLSQATGELSSAQVAQRRAARSKAVISRRLTQLNRLETERLEVLRKLADAGIELIIPAEGNVTKSV